MDIKNIKVFFRFLLDMLQLILSPRKGWEDVAIDAVPARRLLIGGYLPFIVLVALTCIPGLWYHSDATLPGVIQQTISCFVKFFAGYYLSSFFFSLYMPSCTGGEVNPNKNSTFIMYSLGLLALFNLLTNLLPMVPDMLYLLPVYLFFIMWRGITYMEVRFNGVLTFMALNLLAVMIPPFLLQYLFNLIRL